MIRATAVALLCGLAVTAAAQVDSVATQTELARRADEARSQRLLDKAVAHYQAHGDRAFDDFNRSAEFVDRELYVYVIDLRGRMLASGGSSVALVGREVLAMRDAAGKPFFRELLDKAATESSASDRSTDDARNSNTILRLCRTRSLSVATLIPSSAGREHDGTSVRLPSTSTTHTLQTFTGVSVSR